MRFKTRPNGVCDYRPLLRTTLLLLVPSLTGFGCLVIPIKKAGPPLRLEFLSTGSVSRADVEERFSQVDAGVRVPGVFMGRWIRSGPKIWWLVGGGAPGGAIAAESGKTQLGPTVRNFVVEFDAAGRVRSHRRFSDGRLLEELAELRAADFNVEEEISYPHSAQVSDLLEYGRGVGSKPRFSFVNAVPDAHELIIERDRIEVRLSRPAIPWEDGQGARLKKSAEDDLRRVGLDKLDGMALLKTSRQPNSSRTVAVAIRFSTKTSLGRRFAFFVRTKDLRLIVQHLRQTRPDLKLR